MLILGRTFAVVAIVMITVTPLSSARAQASLRVDEHSRRVVGIVGIGASTAPGAQAVVRFDFETTAGLVSVRWLFSRERLVTVLAALPNERNTDLGIQYGIASQIGGPFTLSLSAGVSFLSVVRRGRVKSSGFLSPTRHEKSVSRRLGIPFDVGIRIGPSHRLGAIIGIAGTFAGTESFGGPVVGISVPGSY